MAAAPRPSPDPFAAIGAAGDRLPLTVSVGFTGHRTIEDEAAAEAAIAAAFEAIARAFKRTARRLADVYEGEPRLRLLVGGAPGADRLAAKGWQTGGRGEAHFVYPFRDPKGHRAAYTANPADGDPDTRVTPPAHGAWTGFDAASLGLEGAQPHTEVARWIVRHADILVAFWDGEPGRGAGGTNDTIGKALERELPVIWLSPGSREPRLIDPASTHRHAEVSEAVAILASHAAPLDAAAVARLLLAHLAPPGHLDAEGEDTETVGRLDYQIHDPMAHPRNLFGAMQRLFDRTVWRAYHRFERVVGRAPPAAPEAAAIPSGMDLQPGWARLARAADAANGRAGYLANIHRSEQLLLIAIAIMAVFIGALPAVIGDAEVKHFHIWAAVAEFGLGALALTISRLARRANRHRRWSDARRLAERLRAAMATWPLGFDIADAHGEGARAWTEWRAQALLRAAGPMRGWITHAHFVNAVRCARARLIASQVAYHGRQRIAAANIERAVRITEGVAFGSLMVSLVVFLGYSALVAWAGLPAPPVRLTNLLILVSAVSPAVGAGCLALDATNGFEELAEHSQRMELEFKKLQTRLGRPGRASYHHASLVLRHAAQTLVDDADAWRDRLLRRRIVRGG